MDPTPTEDEPQHTPFVIFLGKVGLCALFGVIGLGSASAAYALLPDLGLSQALIAGLGGSVGAIGAMTFALLASR